MHAPTPTELSQLFTNLVGRPIAFTRLLTPEVKSTKSVYATYSCVANNKTVLLKVDLALLGSCAGALVGLPDTEVRARLASPSIDEVIQDALAEVLNVASALFSREGRTVYTGMTTDAACLDPEARGILAKPSQKLAFSVTVQDYLGGTFTLFS